MTLRPAACISPPGAALADWPRLRAAAGTSLASAAVVGGAVALATITAATLDRHVSLTVLAMVYLVAVVGVAYRSSLAASSATALLAVAALDFFFVPPRGTFSVASSEHVVTLLALQGVALLVSSLSARLRSTANQAQQRARRAQNLQRFAGELAGLDAEDEILRAGLDALREAAGATATIARIHSDGRLTPSEPGAPPLRPGTELHDALAHCSAERRALGPGTGRWDALAAWYLPLAAGGRCFGAIAASAAGGTAEAFGHLGAIADLLAGALQRARHAGEALAANSEAQAHKLRNALLASVSHDFRTPLASIVGAVSSLQQQHDRLDGAQRERLLALIDDEARHLSAITDNTLQWARLAGPEPALRLDWESIEEIVGSVLTRVRRRDPARRVRAQIPADLPLVRADAVLLGQLLDNLLDNALKYSDGPVELCARAAGDTLTVEVRDSGPGIADDELPRIFDAFARGTAARGYRGAGLGLAVCRAIAQAHAATLVAAPRRAGGSRFVLRLPVDTSPAIVGDVQASV